MPEGDTLFRVAATLRPAMCGLVIRSACQGRDWHIGAESLVGGEVTRVEARGKHLLIYLGDGRAVHSHLGMTGSWHVYRPGERWQKPEHRAALTISLDERVVVCFSPKTLQLLTADERRRHRFLNNLGPDLLDPNFDFEQAIDRYRKHSHRPVGEAVMNQTIACGIGNEYKSEILFLESLNPFLLVAHLSDDDLLRLLNRAQNLMRRNLHGPARRTRFGRDGSRVWVYGRSGDACFRCGTTISMSRQGDLGRSTYWCAACQPAAESN